MLGRSTVLRKAVAGALLFILVVLAYLAPLILDSSTAVLREARVEQLLDELLARELVRRELARDLLALLALLGFVCLGCCRLGGCLARRWSMRPFLLCLALLLVVWLALVSGNAWLFPQSDYSVAFQVLASPGWALASLGLLLSAVLFAIGRPVRRSVWRALAGVTVLGVIVMGCWFGSAETGASGRTRSIILIGVDSLSADVFEKNQALLPNLAALMARAERYNRAYTPLGRTFPAWVSILSGKLPAEHGAVFNLRNLEYVERRDLLSSQLQSMGYHTVFAIDERRFANIDESFGFDRVVGPKVGALDFTLQGINDNPLSNLLLQTPLGAHLFPYSYLNVASHANYSATGFVESVLESVQVDKPLLLAVHFESGHFPYKTRHVQMKVQHENRFMARYLEAMTVVDRQVGQLLVGLKDQGRLEDALLILLSDHGEALGEVEARILRDGQLYELSSYGHGSNLLSDQQNHILLGALRFVGGEPVNASMESDRQVSLLGVRALAEAFAHHGELRALPGGKCLMVETGIRMAAARDYRSLKEGEVATQAAFFYEIDAQGRLRLREDRLQAPLAVKDIGWRCEDRLTWYEAAGQRYLAYHLDSNGKPVEQVEPDTDAMAHIAAYRERYLQ